MMDGKHMTNNQNFENLQGKTMEQRFLNFLEHNPSSAEILSFIGYENQRLLVRLEEIQNDGCDHRLDIDEKMDLRK